MRPVLPRDGEREGEKDGGGDSKHDQRPRPSKIPDEVTQHYGCKYQSPDPVLACKFHPLEVPGHAFSSRVAVRLHRTCPKKVTKIVMGRAAA